MCFSSKLKEHKRTNFVSQHLIFDELLTTWKVSNLQVNLNTRRFFQQDKTIYENAYLFPLFNLSPSLRKPHQKSGISLHWHSTFSYLFEQTYTVVKVKICQVYVWFHVNNLAIDTNVEFELYFIRFCTEACWFSPLTLIGSCNIGHLLIQFIWICNSVPLLEGLVQKCSIKLWSSGASGCNVLMYKLINLIR